MKFCSRNLQWIAIVSYCMLSIIIKSSLVQAEEVVMENDEFKTGYYATSREEKLASIMKKRADDWRVGSIVYQVLVDRFAISKNLASKKSLYSPPKRLLNWEQLPKRGKFLGEEVGLYEHELDFYGGDLPALIERVSYLKELGVNTLYLNPIHYAYTFHKYDAIDYRRVSPEYGTIEDLKQLTDTLHKEGMYLVLDGVFNHVGSRSHDFQAAIDPNNPRHKERKDWFYKDPTSPNGYKLWEGVANLAELNLENPAVQKALFADKNSVLAYYLREIGIDGWRFDVAHDIGPKLLMLFNEYTHKYKKEAWTTGEIMRYHLAEPWRDALDGSIHFILKQTILFFLQNQIDGYQMQKIMEDIIHESAYESLLKSWIILENHDTPRIYDLLNTESVRLAEILQFTLAGSPLIYYGHEIGMGGAGDPENRAPMNWNLISTNNPHLASIRKLIDIRQALPALRYGNMKVLPARQQLFAFMRFTHRANQLVVILVNPTTETLDDQILLSDPYFPTWKKLVDKLGSSYHVQVIDGFIDAKNIPPKSAFILVPEDEAMKHFRRVE
ncbi:alpha-amylase family glycosyl hydrolase [Candidatus Parabeggiatoa sp. HSG14]|uniref:alpha-amylase family glycosyl hydrolase n=1 Tax=Candidatus Parabeggiatoa sp. HSG14 TaxID=3055593 RepID=UPI0025A6E1A0|nr:alpha-amylase family glycosyl hydrolase [Thiotrichales bacterium HSG14]